MDRAKDLNGNLALDFVLVVFSGYEFISNSLQHVWPSSVFSINSILNLKGFGFVFCFFSFYDEIHDQQQDRRMKN